MRAKDKLAGRLESLSEDMAIVLLTLRGEVPFDEEIAEGLLSNDKPTFSSALQDLKGSIQRHVARMEMKAAEEALDGKRQASAVLPLAARCLILISSC